MLDDEFESRDLCEDDNSGHGEGHSRRRNRGRGGDDFDKVTGIKVKGYTFDLVDGEVTNLMRIKKGVAKPESIEINEIWTFIPDAGAGTLIRTEIFPNGREVKTYRDDPSTTEAIYIFASEQIL